MCVFKCEKNILAVIISLIVVSFSNAQVYNMGNLGTISTCSGYFYDSGGSGGNYASGENSVATFCSAAPGQPIYIQFTQFSTENFYDSLIIHNGPNVTDPVLTVLTGTLGASSTNPLNVISSNASNCITLEFRADVGIQYIGWAATVGCGTPPVPPPTPCDAASAFCTGTNYNFPAGVDAGQGQVGPDYDCLGSTPNPVWYFLQIDQPGNLNITLANTNNVDVDFVCWGPFPSSNVCGQLTSNKVVDCSFLPDEIEYINISGAQSGQYYILCITNYDNDPTNFTLTTTGGGASTNCAILCDITNMTVLPGACDVATNTHTITGNIITQYPPSTGTLTITTNTGQSVVLNAPFTGNTAYSLPGIPSTGGVVTVRAQFSTDTGCNYTTTYFAPAPCVCSVDASNNSPTCAGGSVTLTATALGNNVTAYQWTGPNGYTSSQQNPVINNATPLVAGTYTVSITAGSCTATDTTTVVVGPTPTITPTVTNLTCNGAANGSIRASSNAVAPITYQWAGNSNTYPSDSIINGLAAGTYMVTVTGANGCSVTGTYQVTQPTAITIGSPTITQATCSNGGSISVTATGGTAPLGYLWSNSATTPSISNLAAGPYGLTVTDANGCTATATYSVAAAPNAIAFGNANITHASCAGSADGSITTNVTGGVGTLNYIWSNSQTTPNAVNLTAGTYTLTVTDANGCSASASYTVNGNLAIVFGSPVITVVTCDDGGTITASASGGNAPYTYTWSGTYQTGSYIDSLSAGSYTLTVTDANGCTAADTYVVGTDPSAVAITNPVVTNVSCVGATDGSISVTFTGGTGTITGTWSNSQTGNSITGLAVGTYTITASDPTGCSATATFEVSGPAGLTTTNPVVVDAICYQSPTGSIDVTPVGGTPPYTFAWSNSQTGKTATSLVAGMYTVTVTDANGCNTSASGEVKEPTQLVIDSLVATPIKCTGDINGTITAFVSGGIQPYNYSATQDGTSFYYASNGIIEGLAVGAYTVVVSDNNGCTIVDTTSVGDVIPDSLDLTTDSTSCYGTEYNDGAIHVIAYTDQVNGPYWYSIDGGAQQQQSPDFYGLIAGEYKIQAVSAKGCTTTISATVHQPLQMFADINPDTLTLALGESGEVLATYQNATDVMYSWNPSYGLSCGDCPNPTVTAYNRTDYVLTISMQSGDAICYAKAKLHVGVEEAEHMYVPNAFTPNGDGNNDLFLIYSQDIQKVNVKIFNRWGELVFESLNQFQGWDGMYKGVLAPSGLYTYTVQATRLDNSKEEKNGSIMLIR